MIKSRRKRITPIRTAIIKFIFDNDRPQSAPGLLMRLRERKLEVNKTTVYRELRFLMKQGLIKAIHLEPFKVHYEPSDLEHHHHIICENCGKIDKVRSTDLEETIKRVIKSVESTGFGVREHDLEFYGLCAKCH